MEINHRNIVIHYDGNGERIKSHQMKASLVASSIRGLEVIYSEAFKEANRIYKSRMLTDILIEGGFREGSFWWLLKLFSKESESQQIFEKKSLYNAVLESIGVVVNLLKKMDISTTEIIVKETENGFEVLIDGKEIILDELQCAILTNPKVRAALGDIAKPLAEDGVDILTIDQDSPNTSVIKIDKEHNKNLLLARSHKHIIEEGEVFGFYYVEDLSYNPKTKWKLVAKDNPSNKIEVSITDPKFLKRVSENKEKFSKDDLLEIQGGWYKEKTKHTGKTNIQYTVTLINNHVPAEDRQWKLI